jgi:hypothetical protein
MQDPGSNQESRESADNEGPKITPMNLLAEQVDGSGQHSEHRREKHGGSDSVPDRQSDQ